MKADIEIFHSGRWWPAASFHLLGEEAKGYRSNGLLAYDTFYATNFIDQFGIAALSVKYPVDFSVHKTPAWPAFLLDLLPTGAGRRALLNLLNQPEQGAKSDWFLLITGASNPPGNLRIRQAMEALPKNQQHMGFTKNEVIERADQFIEYAYNHGAPVSGSTGVQGDAPKFLLTVDHKGYWHADGMLLDELASQHFIVKLPRGHLASDYAVLRNEAAYYQVAQKVGLRVHALPEFINNTLFIPRFDRLVRNREVVRFGQESLCSLANVADFGKSIALDALCAAFIPYVDNPKRELQEFLYRDILNVALGNTDNHARNTAISKYPDGTIALSPLYDFAPMILDEQGIARSCRWQDADNGGFPEWKKIAERLGKSLAKFNIETIDLQKLFYAFANTTAKLPRILKECNVDKDLIERLTGRILKVTSMLREAKPYG